MSQLEISEQGTLGPSEVAFESIRRQTGLCVILLLNRVLWQRGGNASNLSGPPALIKYKTAVKSPLQV